MQEDYDFDILTVIDDEGKEHQFEEIDRIELDDGKRYVAVMPVLEDAEEIIEDDGDVIILTVTEKGEETYLAEIEDEEEFEEIYEIFEKRISKMFDEDFEE